MKANSMALVALLLLILWENGQYSHNPLLQKPGNLVGVGHSSMFKDKAGDWKIVFQAHQSESAIHPRNMFIGTVGFGNINSVDQLYIDTAFKTPRLIEKREMMFGDMSRTGVPFSKDPHVVYHGGRYLMYYSIPPKKGDEKSGWNIGIVESRDLIDWKQPVDAPILFPQLPWEGECIEGASITIQNNKMYMFYAGAYNNWPQQVGVAVSDNGLTWKRVFDEPFLSPKEWMIALESLKYTNV